MLNCPYGNMNLLINENYDSINVIDDTIYHCFKNSHLIRGNLYPEELYYLKTFSPWCKKILY